MDESPRFKDLDLSSYIASRAVAAGPRLEVRYPYTGALTGTIAQIGPPELESAITAALRGGEALSPYRRGEILEKAKQLLIERADAFANLIRLETGLAMRDTRHEVGRAIDVLTFSAMEALRDDGEISGCDVTPHGKARKIFTLREPLRLAAAITPFNHPLNQVAHKVGPAIAAGTPLLLKPSDKTPLTAVKFAELLYEAGLPGWMLSVFVAPIETVIEPMIRDPRIELVMFTGSVSVGKRIAAIAGYKRLCLELGGNSELIVFDDADLDLAASLAAEGSYRNSGQRCTAVKRLLIHEPILAEFTSKLVAKTREYICGDPANPQTYVGTIISEPAAKVLEDRVQKAVKQGAKVLCGGGRHGAQMQPTVLAHVPRDAEMVVEESFGPLSPILAVRDVADAINLANATAYGLSSAVVTNRLDRAVQVIKGVRTGTVNVNETPGFRTERSPFGGVKDSGLGVKEGIVEAMRVLSNVKTFSLPW
jgi:aldehyde dehydrogenase (NAD+)